MLITLFQPETILAFLTAAVLPQLFIIAIERRFDLKVTVRIDFDNPTPNDIRDYILEIAQRLDANPEKMRIRFFMANKDRHRISIDLDNSKRMVINVEGHRPAYADIRGRWIPDHPLPLTFRSGRKPTVLYVTPVDANRFRVTDKLPQRSAMPFYAAVSIIATIGIILASGVIFAVAAGLLSWRLASSGIFTATLKRIRKESARS